MAASNCNKELIKRACHIQTRSAQGEPQQCSNLEGVSSIDLSVFPASLPSLKGSARFHHYELVWKILRYLHRGSGCPGFVSSISKYRAAQDVMEILHFETVIEDLLIESEFHSHYLHLRGNDLLLTIMTYDFLKYKCSLRLPNTSPDGIPQVILQISQALWDYRVKLNATWSRMRVTASAQSLIQLLPANQMEQLYTISTTPLFCRVLGLKVGNFNSQLCSGVIPELAKLGVSMVSSQCELGGRPSIAILEDGLVALSAECREILYDSNTRMKKGVRMLYPQDISSLVCIGKLTARFKSLRKPKKDVIITNCDRGGAIVSQVASLIGHEESNIFVFEVPPVNMKSLKAFFDSIMLKNIHMIPAQFKNADPLDELFADVGVIVCNPPCSLSAVQQPIDYIIQEGEENMAQLFMKSRPINYVTLEMEQSLILSNALRFKQINHVAYFTRSSLERENGELIKRVLMENAAEVDESNDYEWSGYEMDPDSAYNYKSSNGFLCSFKPAPPKPLPTASEVITKAIRLGVLDPSGIDGLDCYTTVPPKLKKKPSKKRIFSQHNGIPLTFSAKQKIVQKPKRETNEHIGRQPKPFL